MDVKLVGPERGHQPAEALRSAPEPSYGFLAQRPEWGAGMRRGAGTQQHGLSFPSSFLSSQAAEPPKHEFPGGKT